MLNECRPEGEEVEGTHSGLVVEVSLQAGGKAHDGADRLGA